MKCASCSGGSVFCFVKRWRAEKEIREDEHELARQCSKHCLSHTISHHLSKGSHFYLHIMLPHLPAASIQST